MSLSRLGNRGRPSDFTWPGFVDALASLLMVFVFVLMVFVIIQANLSFRISGQDSRITALQNELLELGSLLNMERETNLQLSSELSNAQLKVTSLEGDNEQLLSQLASLQTELSDRGDEIIAQQADISALSSQIFELEDNLESARSLADERSDEIEALILRLTASAEAFAEQSDAFNNQAIELQQSITLAKDREERISILDSKIENLNAKNTLTQEELSEKQRLLLIAEQALLKQAEELKSANNASNEAKAEIDKLLASTTALRLEIQKLSNLLADKERQSINDKIAIADLGKKLNSALATRVQDLQKFRSEFFGQLREVLKNRSEVRVVGDRFIFQSEVLFATGQADISDAGKEQLAEIASALREIEEVIPKDIPWVLQIEGHTDSDPIADNPFFKDNWDLSTERALSVVRFLRSEGIPANRLAAAGYGEFQPIDTQNSEAAKQRNRRIELKLTQRIAPNT
ncbi:MAG: flagellar motor protein [SAR116 cluster bacterium]|jgi:chemotaxis protein MotB|nr:MAG: flagellar motor protein [SAR116 cluster bacterium]